MSARFVQLDAALLVEVGAEWDLGISPDKLAPAALAHGWGMIEGAEVLGAGGVVPLPIAGHGRAWLIATPAARRRHLALARRFAGRWFATLLEDGAFSRLEATVPVRFPAGCRFASGLGFALEGVMRHYGPDGADHHLLARVAP